MNSNRSSVELTRSKYQTEFMKHLAEVGEMKIDQAVALMYRLIPEHVCQRRNMTRINLAKHVIRNKLAYEEQLTIDEISGKIFYNEPPAKISRDEAKARNRSILELLNSSQKPLTLAEIADICKFSSFKWYRKYSRRRYTVTLANKGFIVKSGERGLSYLWKITESGKDELNRMRRVDKNAVETEPTTLASSTPDADLVAAIPTTDRRES